MYWSEQQTYAAEPATPAAARRFTIARLRQVLGDDHAVSVIDNAVLAVSELVTNAVHARATTVTVALTIHRGHLRLAVTDNPDGQPTMRIPSPSPRATGGRGLRIIEQLAQQWGTRSGPDSKQVWAELWLDHPPQPP